MNALWHYIGHYGMFCLLLFTLAVSCKKDQAPEVSAPLSKNTPDLSARLVAIKEQYYDQKLDAKFLPKSDKGVFWTPDWNSPKLQTVNDSVSYIFFPMKASIKRDGKLAVAIEAGAATYLMVKNEKEFYKAFYYLPANKRSQVPENDSPEAIMQHFTGKLLLSSLQNGRNYLLEYENGRVSEAYQKNQMALKKLQSVGSTVSYFETQCHQEMVSCTYYTYLPSCGGQIIIEYSWDCRQPNYCQNSIWILSDSSTQDVCEQVWFPDPPIDPGSGGSGGGDDTNVEDPGEDYELLVTQDPVDLKKRLDCFNNIASNGNTTYSIKICADIPVNGNPKALLNPDREPGHTFLELTKTNGGTSVTETIGFYPEKYKKAAFQLSVSSMVVDNFGHEYDASLLMAVNASQFEQILTTAKEKAVNDYHMTGYNCTTFALDVFNSARASNNQLIVPNTVPPNTVFSSYGKTPNGLYSTIKTMAENNTSGASVAAGTGKASTNCGP